MIVWSTHVQAPHTSRQPLHHFGRDDQKLAILLGDDVGGALHARQRRHLAEEIAFVQIIQDDVLVIPEIACRHTALQNEIRRIARLAAIDDNLPARRFCDQMYQTPIVPAPSDSCPPAPACDR